MPICYFCGLVDRASGPNKCPSCENSYSSRPGDEGADTNVTEPQATIQLPPHLYEVCYNEGGRDMAQVIVEATSTQQARHRVFCWRKNETGVFLDLAGNRMRFLSGDAQRIQLKNNIMARKYRGGPVTSYITESPTEKGRMIVVELATSS